MSGGSGPGASVRRAVDLVELDGIVVSMPLTEAQRDGRACVHCGATLSPSARVTGHVAGRPVWACQPSCDTTSEVLQNSSLQSPASLGDSAPAREVPPSPGPNLLPDPRAEWRSPSPPASTSHDRGDIPTAGNRVWQYLADMLSGPPVTPAGAIAGVTGWLLDRIVGLFTVSVRFAGPLTAPTAPSPTPATVVGPDPREPAIPSSAGSPGGPDDNRFFPMAWDCLFDDEPGHFCVNRDGQPIRAGQSCWPSASVMSRRDFATRSPRLYAKAVALKIIQADKAVV